MFERRNIGRHKGENSSKQQIVRHDPVKPFFEPPPTSNEPTRDKRKDFQSPQLIADTDEHIDGVLILDDCFIFFPAPFSVPMPIGRTTTTAPTSEITPITSAAAIREVTGSPSVFTRSLAPEPPYRFTATDVAPTIPSSPETEIQPLLPDKASLHEKQSLQDNITENVDAAARNLRKTPLANTSTVQLGTNTSAQRKPQQLSQPCFPDKVISFESPQRKTKNH